MWPEKPYDTQGTWQVINYNAEKKDKTDRKTLTCQVGKL